jgi:hypothetical protein
VETPNLHRQGWNDEGKKAYPSEQESERARGRFRTTFIRRSRHEQDQQGQVEGQHLEEHEPPIFRPW